MASRWGPDSRFRAGRPFTLHLILAEPTASGHNRGIGSANVKRAWGLMHIQVHVPVPSVPDNRTVPYAVTSRHHVSRTVDIRTSETKTCRMNRRLHFRWCVYVRVLTCMYGVRAAYALRTCILRASCGWPDNHCLGDSLACLGQLVPSPVMDRLSPFAGY